jgi:16S rRNA (uracil1498-N3)-methyltransferase
LRLAHKDVNIFIWPEWGFSEEEIENFLKNNFKKVFLWNRILRTETAGVVTGFYITQSK